MKKILLAAAAATTIVLTVGSVQANPYMVLGCVGCHGVNGAGASAPALAGKDAAWIVKQLKDFQSGARKNATMNAMAGMAAGQEQAIADFLASK
jgi:cytochrome c553